MQQAYSLQNIFFGRMFRIPDYQRGYAWEETQWRELLEDLELLSPEKDHYTGTLVLCPADGQPRRTDVDGNSYELLDVVDGQQRLTTIVLLIDAICEEMRSTEGLQIMAPGLRKTYVVTSDQVGQSMPKLVLNRDCRDYFGQVVLGQGMAVGGPRIRSHQLLSEARAYFSQYLKGKRASLGDGFAGWLDGLRQKTTQQLKVLVYVVGAESEAGVIFETMNSRGKPVTEMEKVKNYLLYLSTKLELQSAHDLGTVINTTWTHIFESLMTAGLANGDHEDQLLRAHWLMAYDYQMEEWEESRSIKDRFNLREYQGRHPKLLDDLRSYCDTLAAAAVAYCDVYNPTRTDAFSAFRSDGQLRTQLTRAGEKLPRLGNVASFAPLLMAVRLKFPTQGDRYLETVELCEKFAFRVFHWVESRSDTGRSSLNRLANDLFKGQDFDATVNELRGLLLYYCPDDRLSKEFKQDEANWYGWSGITYLLYEYEEHLAAKAGLAVRLPWAAIARRRDSIEHVLPQHPANTGYWADRFTDALREKYTNDIGNLCLTYYNSQLSNRPFPEKRGEPGKASGYVNSVLLSEMELARNADWTEKEILARRKAIEDWVVVRWNVPAPPKSKVDGSLTGLEAIEALAEKRSVGGVYRKIMAAALRHGLYAKPRKRCVVYAPPSDHRLAVFTVWPEPGSLWLGFWPAETWEHHQRAVDIMGSGWEKDITEENVDEFIASLDSVCRPSAAEPMAVIAL